MIYFSSRVVVLVEDVDTVLPLYKLHTVNGLVLTH